MKFNDYFFSGTHEQINVVVNYCQDFDDSEVANLLSRYRWDDLIANIHENLAESFYKTRRWEAIMEHSGLVIGQNNLVKVVLRDIDGCRAALAVLVPHNSVHKALSVHHLEAYAKSLFDSLATKYDYTLTIPAGMGRMQDYIAVA